jgi:hypothetical protein
MNEREALARYHDWRASRHTPTLALTMHQAGSGPGIDWAGHPVPGGRHVILLYLAAASGAKFRHRPLNSPYH